jgi:hypothetical protein
VRLAQTKKPKRTDVLEAIAVRGATRARGPGALSAPQELQINRDEYQDNSDVDYQPCPEVVPQEEYVYGNDDRDQREHKSHDDTSISQSLRASMGDGEGEYVR